MIPVNDIFEGPVKTAILTELSTAQGPVYAGDLCERVFGSREKRHRDSLRNLIAQMRPRLAERGLAIHGRKQLRMNAYALVSTVLE